MFFHGQNVSIGQRSPIMRIFLFFLFCFFFSARWSIHQTPDLHVPLPIFHLGYFGRFVRPMVCRACRKRQQWRL